MCMSCARVEPVAHYKSLYHETMVSGYVWQLYLVFHKWIDTTPLTMVHAMLR